MYEFLSPAHLPRATRGGLATRALAPSGCSRRPVPRAGPKPCPRAAFEALPWGVSKNPWLATEAMSIGTIPLFGGARDPGAQGTNFWAPGAPGHPGPEPPQRCLSEFKMPYSPGPRGTRGPSPPNAAYRSLRCPLPWGGIFFSLV